MELNEAKCAIRYSDELEESRPFRESWGLDKKHIQIAAGIKRCRVRKALEKVQVEGSECLS